MKVGDMMKVEVNGKIEHRRINSIDTETLTDGREIPVRYNPQLNEGEGVVSLLDGSTIIFKTTNWQHKTHAGPARQTRFIATLTTQPPQIIYIYGGPHV